MPEPAPAHSLSHLHAAFLAILPRIELHARVYFRGLKCPHRKADAVQETLADVSVPRTAEGAPRSALAAGSPGAVVTSPSGAGWRNCPVNRPRATAITETSPVTQVGRPGAPSRVGAGLPGVCRRRRNSSSTLSSPRPGMSCIT